MQVVDEITESSTSYTYDSAKKDRIDTIARTGGTGVEALVEDYTYNDHGLVSERNITGAVNHSYTYRYKENAAKDIDA